MIAAVLLGCIIALQTAYIIRMNDHLDQLQAKVCRYQETAVDLARALAEAGRPLPPGTLPPPEACP